MTRAKPNTVPSPTMTSRYARNLAGKYFTELAPTGVAFVDRDVRTPWAPECQICSSFFLSEQTLTNVEGPTRKMYKQFNHFLSGAATAPRLRLQFSPPTLPLCRCHWLSFDLDVVEQRAKESGTAVLDFPNDYFDRVLCTDIEAISRPIDLIAEIFRVVKPGGRVWLQTPPPEFSIAGKNATRPTYRSITPVGMRLLLKNFQEVDSSAQSDPEHTLQGTSFYFGTKNTLDALAQSARAPEASTLRGKVLLERLAYFVRVSTRQMKGNPKNRIG